MRARVLVLGAAYTGLAAVTTWPAVLQVGERVPGAQRTDVYNALWSIWFVPHALVTGQLPYHTDLLDHPDGGSILVSDSLGGLLAAPLVLTLGVSVAYTLLVLARLALSGVVAHLFASELIAELTDLGQDAARRAGWIAGVGYCAAPVLLSAVHNGSSEAIDGGWAALAAWLCWRAARHGGWGRSALGGLALLVAALASWYSAVVAFLFAGSIALLGARRPWRTHLGPRVAAVILGLLLVLPVAVTFQRAATGQDNLVGIKNARELASVRRTVGPADPVGYLAPGDYRSPDFRELSKYGEGFFHCHYLGFVLLAGAALGLWRRGRSSGALWLAALAGLLLSFGPVLARHGAAVIVMGDRAIPLPYLLVERLPGFSSLSLLYRLAQAPALGLALLAALGWAGRQRWIGPAVAVVILLEGRFLSPLGGLPDTVEATVQPSIEALAEAPDGAIMNFPVAGGRAYLFEQTVHGKPVAGTLNFPNNLAARRVWKTMLEHADAEPDAFLSAAAAESRRRGIRYVVVHIDPMARPDMHDEAVRALKAAAEPLAGSEGTGVGEGAAGTSVRVYQLW